MRAALVKNQILAHPVTPKAGAQAAAEHRQSRRSQCLRTFNFGASTLWLTNQPVLILSAEARIPGSTGAPAAAEPYQRNARGEDGHLRQSAKTVFRRH
jgi:hypothetical protein